MENKISEARKKLYDICEKTQTSKDGMNKLVEYYIHSLGWSEDKACDYALGLFKNGTIEQIKLFGQDGKEIK